MNFNGIAGKFSERKLCNRAAPSSDDIEVWGIFPRDLLWFFFLSAALSLRWVAGRKVVREKEIPLLVGLPED